MRFVNLEINSVMFGYLGVEAKENRLLFLGQVSTS
jgi:hypothetical protein